MKKYFCEICFSKFKTEEGRESHRNRGHKIYEFDNLVFQNRENYFIFEKSNSISRNHDSLYNLITIRKSSVDGNVKGNVFKKSKIYFSSNEINKKIEKKSIEKLSEIELKLLEKYIENFI